MEADWRLNGQEAWLRGRSFLRRRYPEPDGMWDHSHCVFCWQRISTYPEDEGEAYASLDGRWWICCACFREFSGPLELRPFDPARFRAARLSEAIAFENACPPEYPGLHLTGEVIALCRSLDGAALAPERLRITPHIVYLYPRAARSTALPERALSTPPEALAECLEGLERDAAVAAAMDRACGAWKVERGLLRVCVSIQAGDGAG